MPPISLYNLDSSTIFSNNQSSNHYSIHMQTCVVWGVVHCVHCLVRWLHTFSYDARIDSSCLQQKAVGNKCLQIPSLIANTIVNQSIYQSTIQSVSESHKHAMVKQSSLNAHTSFTQTHQLMFALEGSRSFKFTNTFQCIYTLRQINHSQNQSAEFSTSTFAHKSPTHVSMSARFRQAYGATCSPLADTILRCLVPYSLTYRWVSARKT